VTRYERFLKDRSSSELLSLLLWWWHGIVELAWRRTLVPNPSFFSFFHVLFCVQVKNLKALCISLLTSHPTRRVLVMDVTEVRGYRLLTEGRNSEVLCGLFVAW
jgi:hypothetical protein